MDEVQVLVRPAARIVDRVTGMVSNAGRYYLVLLNREDHELCVSRDIYTWEDVISLAGRFKGKDAIRALEWWQRKQP